MSPVNKRSFVAAILITGLVAGTMDITGACISAYISSGLSPVVVLHYVASGALGKAAFSGGVLTALAGLFVHYCIAYLWTVLFFLIYPALSLLKYNKYVVGVLYGVFVWVMMNQVILRLAGMVPATPITITKAAISMCILMICIGLPVSLGANKYYTSN